MYASFTWSLVGSAQDATELRTRLNEIAAELGYVTRRGPTPGRGAGVYALRAVAEGQAALLPLADPHARAWLAERLLELAAAYPTHAEELQHAVIGLRIADEMEQRGAINRYG